jgi:hypothetical protein
MLAWRRANVAALNARARAVMAATVRLTGAELDVDGIGYRAGDRILTLAPRINGDTVTSERGIVTSVDVDTGSLMAIMDDGREQHRFGLDGTGADRLAHGYATTVHRSQGATVDVAYLFADGGGRKLGCVAMSRARHSSKVHVVADGHDQAVEDLVRDWSERRQTWAIDTARPDPNSRGPLAVEADPAAPACHSQPRTAQSGARHTRHHPVSRTTRRSSGSPATPQGPRRPYPPSQPLSRTSGSRPAGRWL